MKWRTAHNRRRAKVRRAEALARSLRPPVWRTFSRSFPPHDGLFTLYPYQLESLGWLEHYRKD